MRAHRRHRARRARAEPPRHDARAAPGPHGRKPESLAVTRARLRLGRRYLRAFPARGLLLQDVHGARLGLGAGLRAPHPARRGPGPTRADRGRSRRSRRDAARARGCPRGGRRRRRTRRGALARRARTSGAARRAGRGLRWRLAPRWALGLLAREGLRGAARLEQHALLAPHHGARSLRAWGVRRSRDTLTRGIGPLRRVARAVAHRARAACGVGHGCARAADCFPRQ